MSRNYTLFGNSTILTWAVIETLKGIPNDKCGTAEDTIKYILDNFAGNAGGLSLGGSLLLFASNFSSDHGFVFEVGISVCYYYLIFISFHQNDRISGIIRKPNRVWPYLPESILMRYDIIFIFLSFLFLLCFFEHTML
jgi:hypothetical protein